jgi:hypothetical protein
MLVKRILCFAWLRLKRPAASPAVVIARSESPSDKATSRNAEVKKLFAENYCHAGKSRLRNIVRTANAATTDCCFN